LTHIQEGQLLQNKAVVKIEDFSILLKCGAEQSPQKIRLPLSYVYREQEVREEQLTNKISKLATASR
jgi:hypothetical protein